MSEGWARPLALLTLLAAVVLLAEHAHASPDPIGSGTVRVSLAAPFKSVLRGNGVRVEAVRPAAGAGTISFPVVEGEFDPGEGSGELETEGGIVLRRGKRRVVIHDLAVHTFPQPLLAKVGGGQLKLGRAASTKASRSGFDSLYVARGIRLSAKLATRLAKKLRLPGVFSAGMPFASLRASAVPRTLAVLPEGSVSFRPDPAFLAKLDSLFVSVNPIAPAQLAPGPLFSLPLIPAGTIAADGRGGVPRSGGSLEFLQLGAGQIFWHELWFDLGAGVVLAEVDVEPAPTFPGKLGQVPILGLDLSTATISADAGARTVAISEASVSLNASTADYFNRAFGGGAGIFAAGERVGGVSLVAQTQ